MTIGRPHVSQLDEQGFCVLEGLFDADEMDALARHVQRMYLSYEEGLRAHGAPAPDEIAPFTSADADRLTAGAAV